MVSCLGKRVDQDQPSRSQAPSHVDVVKPVGRDVFSTSPTMYVPCWSQPRASRAVILRITPA